MGPAPSPKTLPPIPFFLQFLNFYQFRARATAEPLWVNGDKVRLQQVILNLIAERLGSCSGGMSRNLKPLTSGWLASNPPVPGLAVSPDGHRLGRGGGCYDRALGRVPVGTFTCVLLHDGEVGIDVPVEPHDRRMLAAATPSGVVLLDRPGSLAVTASLEAREAGTIRLRARRSWPGSGSGSRRPG